MTTRPQRILVIGGGPTGLVTLRNLKERGEFAHVELYERRDDVGGVWYFDEKEDSKSPSWPSPAYPGLVGNVLPEYLSFSGFPFPEPPSSPMQPFPTLLETHQYLRAFASPYLHSGDIKLLREVVSVSELEGGKGWSVVSKDWRNGGHTAEEIWDAVVVSVGWYDNPIWPETEGLDELRGRGIAHHSKWWRGPKSHQGKRVLVIGNANSSNDIAAQLAPVASTPVYQSIRRPGVLRFPCLPDKRIHMAAPVAKYEVCPDGTTCDAHLADGTVLASLDVVHIGTGYRPFPSLVHVVEPTTESQAKSPSSPSLLKPLASESDIPARVRSLHRMIMYAHNPSLAFIGSTMANTPFTIADLSSTWLALAWRGEVPYPDSPEGRLVFERERLQQMDEWRAQHDNPSAQMAYSVLGASEEQYASTMRQEILQARPELDQVLPLWNSEMTKRREGMYQVKYNALEYTRAHSA